MWEAAAPVIQPLRLRIDCSVLCSLATTCHVETIDALA